MEETPETPRQRPARRRATTARTVAPASQRHAAPASKAQRQTPPPQPDAGALTWRDAPFYDATVATHGDPFARDEDADKAGAELSQQIAEARSWVEGQS